MQNSSGSTALRVDFQVCHFRLSAEMVIFDAK